MYNQYTKTNFISQQEKFKSTDPKIIFKFPENEIRRINERNALIEIFDGVVKAIVMKGNNFAQDYVAAITGYHVDTVNKYIKKLEKMGLLLHLNMGYKKTCLYKISSFFHKREIIESLKDIIPSLKLLLLVVVLKSTNSIFEKPNKLQIGHVGLIKEYNKNKNINTNQIQIYRKREFDLGLNLTKKGEFDMDAYQEASEYLNLTAIGKVKLLVFDEEAIRFALGEYKKAKQYKMHIQKPFAYFYSKAMAYSKQFDLNLDFQKLYLWKEKLGDAYYGPDIENKPKSNTLQDNKLNGQTFVRPQKRDIRFISVGELTDSELGLRLKYVKSLTSDISPSIPDTLRDMFNKTREANLNEVLQEFQKRNLKIDEIYNNG